MKYFKKLIGENIYLSPRNSEDAEKFTQWLNDFETTNYIGRSSQIMTLDSEKKYLEEHCNDEALFAIIQADNDNMIGTISLENINHIKRIATLGIFIGEKEARNQGYGEETIKLLLDYGFRYLNLNNIMLNVYEFNERAIACYKKCGFKECGKRRQAEFLDGKYYDVISMDILAEEFQGKYLKVR